MIDRFVHLSPRLNCAVSMVSPCNAVADIGCDHGRVSAVLLQKHICSNVVATDISEDSLQKARDLIRYIGLEQRVSFRVGDGLSVLSVSECGAVLLLGMGGTLMARILDVAQVPLQGAEYAVFQPMRAQADLREYLHVHNYRITEDRIVPDHGRLYQVLKAYPDRVSQPVPKGWPTGFYDLGFVSFLNREDYLRELTLSQLDQHIRRLQEAKGSSGETVIQFKIDSLKQILSLI